MKSHVELGNYFVTQIFASLRHRIRWEEWLLLFRFSMRMRTLTVHAPRQNIHVFDTSCNVYWHRYLESFIQSNTLTLKTQRKGLLAAKTCAVDCGFSTLRSSSAFSEMSVLTGSPKILTWGWTLNCHQGIAVHKMVERNAILCFCNLHLTMSSLEKENLTELEEAQVTKPSGLLLGNWGARLGRGWYRHACL